MLRCTAPEGAPWRDPEDRGDSGRGYRRLQPARGSGRGSHAVAAPGAAQRSDRPAIDAHHGRIVKRTGDGSLIEFRSVVDAVRCAIEVQNGLIERNAGLPPERRIEFRVGIHLGDVVEEGDGDLMGDGVNIAARLEGIAEPGAICLSEDAYRQVSGRLEMAVTDLGSDAAQEHRKADPGLIRCKWASRLEPKPATEAKRRAEEALATRAARRGDRRARRDRGWRRVFPLRQPKSRPALQTRPARQRGANLSIVVKPFANLSGDPAQDYLADALTDELTTGLAHIRDSFVIARNTAFTYKGKPVDAKAIGKELGVRYVLEGSVQPSGDQVRVNAQLIDADSGARVWAEQFDTARADLLQMQDEIVNHLARAMYYQLPELEAARLKRTPAANPDAEDLALQCQAADTESRISRQGSGSGFPPLRTGARDRSQQRPRPGLFGRQVRISGHVRLQRRPESRPQAGGRIKRASARHRSKFRRPSPV